MTGTDLCVNKPRMFWSHLNHLVPTKLSVYFVGYYDVQKNPPLTTVMSLTNTSQSSQTISFIYPPKPPNCFFLLRFPKQTLYSLLLYYMYVTCHICIIFLATIMLTISGEE